MNENKKELLKNSKDHYSELSKMLKAITDKKSFAPPHIESAAMISDRMIELSKIISGLIEVK
jgi:hypothetical protein